MPRFIRIQEATRHACYVTLDEIRNEIDVTRNPDGFGYTDVAACMSQFTNPEAWGAAGHVPFPVPSRLGPVTFHIEGRMDYQNNLVWKEPGHRCDPYNPECAADAAMTAIGLAPSNQQLRKGERNR